MNEYDFDVRFSTGTIYSEDFTLVVNDHNSTKFNFKFDMDGRKVFKLLYPDNAVYVVDIDNNELTISNGILYQEGIYQFEIALYGYDSRLTTAKTKAFEVRHELVSTDELVEPDDRVPVLDALIEDVNEILNEVSGGEFDGATFIPNVDENGNLTWTNNKGLENPETVNITGPQGEQGIQGETGATGETGAQGVSVENMEIVDGNLLVTYSE